ncbi:MAG TPA: response regulator [Desulfuromonadales bacterium]|nr:response regulator [Desulfuromonadales bacterium]
MALSLAQAEKPDLVLLDVMMPGMNGFEVCETMKADPGLAGIPVIFVTALEKSLDESRGLSLGAIDYITKPISPDLVLLRVRNHLELKLQRDQLCRQRDELAHQKAELEESLRRIRRLEGIISICMYCKKIRSEDKSWQQLEQYVCEHSDAQFSHGICPECFKDAVWKQ